MKKCFWFCITALFAGLIMLSEPMEVRAENYYWTEAQETVSGGDVVNTAGWYKIARPSDPASVKMDGAPESLTSEDAVVIDCAPDEACSQWLKSLSGDNDYWISIFYQGDVQIGNPDSTEKLTLSILNAYYGNLKVYADVYFINAQRCNLLLDGSVDSLRLGDEQVSCSTETIDVTGNVNSLVWYKKELIPDAGYYAGFAGNVNIGGSLNSGEICSLVYDDSVKKYTWQITGEIGACEAGVFQMNAGVLSEQVQVTEVTPELGNYRFQYQCSGLRGDKTYWTKQAYNASTNQFAYSEECEVQDIPSGAKVLVYSTNPDDPIIINTDLSYLYIYPEGGSLSEADVTVNGDVETADIYVNALEKCSLNIKGDVSSLKINYRYNPKYNITVEGTVAEGVSYGKTSGWFNCTNMQIIQDGNWNPDLFLRTSWLQGSLSYKPVAKDDMTEALEGNDLGQEVVVSTDEGDKTLVKTAEVLINATNTNVLNTLSQKEEMIDLLAEIEKAATDDMQMTAKATPVCAVDINVNTYFEDKESGNVYSEDPAYGYQAVTELAEGKKLTFTVRIPAAVYDEQAQYTVVRSHTSSDGINSMEKLETTRVNDELTFSSDRFSTFVVVEVKEEAVQEESPTIKWIYYAETVPGQIGYQPVRDSSKYKVHIELLKEKEEGVFEKIYEDAFLHDEDKSMYIITKGCGLNYIDQPGKYCYAIYQEGDEQLASTAVAYTTVLDLTAVTKKVEVPKIELSDDGVVLWEKQEGATYYVTLQILNDEKESIETLYFMQGVDKQYWSESGKISLDLKSLLNDKYAEELNENYSVSIEVDVLSDNLVILLNNREVPSIFTVTWAQIESGNMDVDKTPETEEQPGTEEVPGTEEEPGTEEQPGTEETPGTEEQPGTEETPGMEEQPGIEETPETEEQPGTEETPETEEQPGTEETPGTEEQPGMAETPEEEDQYQSGDEEKNDSEANTGSDVTQEFNEASTGQQQSTDSIQESEDAENVIEIPVTYVVQRGDSLYKIAARQGISLKQLLIMNPQIKNPNRIYPGQIITIGKREIVSDAKNVNTKTYIVKKASCII